MKLSVDTHEAYAYTGGKPFDPSLPCVVFIHGALHDHSGWTLLARWCAHHGFGVLALDQPGNHRHFAERAAQQMRVLHPFDEFVSQDIGREHRRRIGHRAQPPHPQRIVARHEPQRP